MADRSSKKPRIRRGRLARTRVVQDRNRKSGSEMKPETPLTPELEMINKESTWLLLLIRAALFDRAVYRELRQRPTTSFVGLGMVVVVAIAFTVGVNGGIADVSVLDLGGSRLLTAMWRVNYIVFGWVIWSWEAILIGRYAFGSNATAQQMLRSLGFALTPGILFFGVAIPGSFGPVTTGEIVYYSTIVWILITGSLAVKETLQIGWVKGIAAGAFGWLLVYFIVLNVLNIISVGPTEKSSTSI